MSMNSPHLSIFNDPRPPFTLSREPKLLVENLDAFQEALSIFRQLKGNPPSHGNLSRFEPSETLLSSMEQLIDFHRQKTSHEHQQLNTTPLPEPEKDAVHVGPTIKETPKMVQRNAMGGRAWLIESTPRTNRRKKRKYGGSSTRNRPKNLRSEESEDIYHRGIISYSKITVPCEIQIRKEEDSQALSPVKLSATEDSVDDTFDFHSQSSMLE